MAHRFVFLRKTCCASCSRSRQQKIFKIFNYQLCPHCMHLCTTVLPSSADRSCTSLTETCLLPHLHVKIEDSWATIFCFFRLTIISPISFAVIPSKLITCTPIRSRISRKYGLSRSNKSSIVCSEYSFIVVVLFEP